MATNNQTIPPSGADPGFPVGGGSNHPGTLASTYNFVKFSQKLHEIEKIWTVGDGTTDLVLIQVGHG